MPFRANVPKNKSIIPYVEIKVFEVKNNSRKFIGFTSISLYDLIPKLVNNLKTQNQNNKLASE